ncbi:BlaI/MecI/CopY family transcriptional regulator [Ferroacidibacillus organovorans]|uniref:Transcriptional regulator n=2 Tax=Ferroacidibacillus organovorans TaxID=1765683 RepID=A0A101XTG9_9BACL|nr:BlaI/MecI/CopY family transcriptional regulator [Ferroacidibacillus organovorans]KUO97258.1 hypothetical protein ATW55_11745 [Ferroacidibacillus organovorans]KYP80225.1 hypothetical protein AYJ22_12205 [Ferroacidibacillus organovorans]OAG93607.1 hypothetical protein AYW79_09620 [Ferroacidibacillus organovorans]OPG17098.1 hypothetical protein B2M26_03270 [Ferroacidibacillus organovorans]
MWKNGELQAFHLREQGLQRVLGPLEADVMEILWRIKSGTAREVLMELEHKRPFAFNTVMTILKRLCEKELLMRIDEGVARFSPCVTKDELLRRVSQNVSDCLVEEFGELAIVHFVDSVSRRDPDLLTELRRILNVSQHEE